MKNGWQWWLIGEGRVSHVLSHTFYFGLGVERLAAPTAWELWRAFRKRFQAWSNCLKQSLRDHRKAFLSSNLPSTQDLSVSIRAFGPCQPPSEQAKINLPQAPLIVFIISFLPWFWNSFPAHQPLWLHTACRVMPKQFILGKENQNWSFLRPGECPVLG